MACHHWREMKRRIVPGAAALVLAGLVIASIAGCKPDSTPSGKRADSGDAGDNTAEAAACDVAVVVETSGAEATHDFGFVEPETTHLVTYRVRNEADTPLRITKAMSDCPCIRILEHPSSIPAGGAADVRIEYESSERRERYAGQAILFTDRRERPHLRLHVTAVVGLSLEVIPDVLQAGTVAPDDDYATMLRIVNHSGQPIRTTRGSSDNILCTVSVPQVAIPSGQTVQVPIHLRATGPAGPQVAGITIQSDSPNQPTLHATVRWTIGESEQVAP